MVRRVPRAITRTLRVALALLVLVLLAGATYQGVATALERHRFPHPGRLIDIGDHQLHLYCLGEGSPTVVLEAPATGMSSAWGLVQPAVAKVTRTCSYDRAGLGWSEAGDREYSPSRVPDELHALLMNAHEHAPYVIVGEGLGAAFARMYVSRYDQDTAALVEIDAPSGAASAADARTLRLVGMSPWLARAGLLRAANLLGRRARGLPAGAEGSMRAFLNRPDHLARSAEELDRREETLQLADAAPVNPSVITQALSVAGPQPARYLTDAVGAQRAATAIIRVVRRVRAARPQALTTN